MRGIRGGMAGMVLLLALQRSEVIASQQPSLLYSVKEAAGEEDSSAPEREKMIVPFSLTVVWNGKLEYNPVSLQIPAAHREVYVYQIQEGIPGIRKVGHTVTDEAGKGIAVLYPEKGYYISMNRCYIMGGKSPRLLAALQTGMAENENAFVLTEKDLKRMHSSKNLQEPATEPLRETVQMENESSTAEQVTESRAEEASSENRTEEASSESRAEEASSESRTEEASSESRAEEASSESRAEEASGESRAEEESSECIAEQERGENRNGVGLWYDAACMVTGFLGCVLVLAALYLALLHQRNKGQT